MLKSRLFVLESYLNELFQWRLTNNAAEIVLAAVARIMDAAVKSRHIVEANIW